MSFVDCNCDDELWGSEPPRPPPVVGVSPIKCGIRGGLRGTVFSRVEFVLDRTHNGRPLRLLTILEEYTRECLSIDVERKLSSEDVLERLTELFSLRGPPGHLRSDNGPGVHGEGCQGVAGADRSRNALH